MRDDPLVDEEGYPSYNKPYSLMAWLEAEDIACVAIVKAGATFSFFLARSTLEVAARVSFHLPFFLVKYL